ncbi:uncharacterized protein KY384_004879 [Bacidia gigantensis]|uniref:uncharacterized protein n=1 Tax=Bacidia gigantensis TaxID=2732470 RepID=UPI001D04F352|nr:uncharacterized protein KY384_004879 [Bacidia gigantensis]KAG8530377.1 hypothetical protein KY384_004879 [Bacidia gigantensis]
MPRSKRAKVVHLSKTKKKGKELTLRLYASIQENIPKYSYIYVFRVNNMRNTYLKHVRNELADSRQLTLTKPSSPHRLFFGKTKVMAIALGLNEGTEPYPNTSLLSPHLHGNVGLLFSPRPVPDILAYFTTFQPSDYARSGTVAPRSFVIPPGMVYSRGGEVSEEEDVPLAHSIEPTLRKLGVPTRLIKGKVALESEFEVCREGEVLGSGQTSLLKIFGVAMAEFRVQIVACYNRENESVEAFARHPDEDADIDEEMEDGANIELDEFVGFEG